MADSAKEAQNTINAANAAITDMRLDLAKLQVSMETVLRERSGSKTEPRTDPWQRWTVIGGLISVLLVAIGLYQTVKSNASTQKATNAQLLLTVQQQTAQRFTDAIGQLGEEDEKKNGRLNTRLGAIYSLKLLMKDSPSYEPTIIAILSAFVRTHAPGYKDVPTPNFSFPGQPPSNLDVITAVEALGHRPDPTNPLHQSVNLSDTLIAIPKEAVAWGYMDNVYLQRVALEGVNFGNASLAGAVFEGSDLYRAELSGAILNRANLRSAEMYEADLFGTWLQNADLAHANLGEANLNGARVQQADLLVQLWSMRIWRIQTSAP